MQASFPCPPLPIPPHAPRPPARVRDRRPHAADLSARRRRRRHRARQQPGRPQSLCCLCRPVGPGRDMPRNGFRAPRYGVLPSSFPSSRFLAPPSPFPILHPTPSDSSSPFPTSLLHFNAVAAKAGLSCASQPWVRFQGSPQQHSRRPGVQQGCQWARGFLIVGT